MTSARHTAGPCEYRARHPQNACGEVYSRDGVPVATLYGAGEDVGRDENGVWGPHPIRDANGHFIAEAFTVTHETGLTPRQLAERRKELEAALSSLIDLVDEIGGDPLGEDEHSRLGIARFVAASKGGTA